MVSFAVVEEWGCASSSNAGLCKNSLPPPPLLHLAPTGKLGAFVWLLGMFGIAIAAYFEYMEYKYKPAGTTWTIGQAALIWVLLSGLVGLVCTHFAVGTKRHLVRENGVDRARSEASSVSLRFASSPLRALTPPPPFPQLAGPLIDEEEDDVYGRNLLQ